MHEKLFDGVGIIGDILERDNEHIFNSKKFTPFVKLLRLI